MKRIIDGVTYNTDTARVIARADVMDDGWENRTGGDWRQMTLYQTRGGAFFVDVHITTLRENLRTEEWEEVERHEFEPFTRERAHKWVMTGQTEMVRDVFDEPPEAEDETAPGATIYVRVPTSLKGQIEAAATGDRLSVNSWMMRCVERCGQIDAIGERLGEILYTASTELKAPDWDFYSRTPELMKIGHINRQAEEIAKLLGWRGDALKSLVEAAAIAVAINRPWQSD